MVTVYFVPPGSDFDCFVLTDSEAAELETVLEAAELAWFDELLEQPARTIMAVTKAAETL